MALPFLRRQRLDVELVARAGVGVAAHSTNRLAALTASLRTTTKARAIDIHSWQCWRISRDHGAF